MRPNFLLIAAVSLVGAIAFSPVSGVAADIPAASIAEPKDAFAHCAYITNDCEVCSIGEDGKPHCSSTGIACVPKVRRCLIEDKTP